MDILFEDNHLIVVNKPFGMPSQGDETGDLSVFDWVKEYIRDTYQKPGNVYVALLHRLDRPTGGLLVLAKTSKAAERMSRLFQQRKIEKTYYAITESVPDPPAGELRHFLKKLPDKNIMRAYNKEVHASQAAHLAYRVIDTADSLALVEVELFTGRRHQIRVQLASIGCVIRGDVKYGKTSFNPDKSICLFAGALRFEHPIQKQVLDFRLEIPQSSAWQPFCG